MATGFRKPWIPRLRFWECRGMCFWSLSWTGSQFGSDWAGGRRPGGRPGGRAGGRAAKRLGRVLMASHVLVLAAPVALVLPYTIPIYIHIFFPSARPQTDVFLL